MTTQILLKIGKKQKTSIQPKNIFMLKIKLHDNYIVTCFLFLFYFYIVCELFPVSVDYH